ncbi:hypothetical protein GWC77_24180 [Paraburkholderia sp. NMBU_R16]|uniref:hypothetical protein n=1 Tax=Paraburkholderia sp. NMBU_R16 TaxID=2698676 RepID=UPI0015642663|nr:hypothetical protein [Paraburkholderia sp. NMBU_R16]NRO99009.1 hypothetical protein [Paraburkholderia sp. NMBU_R16]
MQRHVSRLTAAVGKTLCRMDGVELVGPGKSDDALLALLRDEGGPASIAYLRRGLDEIDLKTDEIDLRASVKQQFKAQLTRIRQALTELETDRSVSKRVLQVLLPNVVLAAPAFFVPLDAHPRQQQVAAELCALNTKAFLEVIGMMRSPTTGKMLILDRLMARQYANLTQAILFAIPTFVKPSAELSQRPEVQAVLVLLSTALLFCGFLPHETARVFNRRFRGAPAPDLKAAGDRLSPEARNQLADVQRLITAQKRALLDARDSFLTDGNTLSPHFSKQIQLVFGQYGRIEEAISDTLSNVPTQGHNSDRNAKIALTALTAIVTTLTAVLILPDTIGFVDLLSDTAFTTALMASFVNDSNMNRQDALNEFQTFAGLSMVLIVALAANKLAHGFMEKGDKGLLIGAFLLSILNATLPGLVGAEAAKGLDALMNVQWQDVIRRIGIRLRAALRSEMSPTAVASSIQDGAC